MPSFFGKDRPVTVDLPEGEPTREAELRAARQAELFAHHDIAREEVRASLGHHPLRTSGDPLLPTDYGAVVMGSGAELRWDFFFV